MWGNDFHDEPQISKETKNHFNFLHLIFLCYYCSSINLKRQSEPSEFRPECLQGACEMISTKNGVWGDHFHLKKSQSLEKKK